MFYFESPAEIPTHLFLFILAERTYIGFNFTQFELRYKDKR